MKTLSEDKQRMLVIGLDAADRELIEQWCGEGLLPNLSSMRAGGAWANLKTTADVVHVSAWPSIFTGTTPDEHGLYHAYVMKPGQQAPGRPSPADCPVPFLWKLLDDHGRRAIVMDAFLTCPLRDFKGVQIVDWGSWTWFSGQQILPAAVEQEIDKRFGSYPAEDHSKVGMTPPPDPLGFRERLLAGVAKKTEVAQWLMDSQEWDFFLLVYGECHAAGHYFWHYQDETYVNHPQDCDQQLKTALRDVYIALDEAIGKLLKQVDGNTTVIVVSGDGMGPNYSGSHLLGPLLNRMKMVNDEPEQKAEPAGGTRRGVLSTLRNMVPKSFRAAVSKYVLPRAINERLSLHWKTADINWARTRAFQIDNANEGFVRVNLKDREPEGIVTPGSEYDAICAELVNVATGMTNPANGRPAATSVHKTADLYKGPCCGQMPDVIINWDPAAQLTTQLATEQYGVIASEQPGCGVSPYYTGNHLPNAFFAAVGPAVPAGLELQGASVLDLAPTVLAHFGLGVPGHMDGSIVTALLDKEVAATG